MKFKIHHEQRNALMSVEDTIVVYGQTVEECQQAAQDEMRKRGWVEENCWSEPWD